MKTIREEIETYRNNVRLAEKTIQNYTIYLNKFVTFLSNELNENPHNIYLDKIYLLTDRNGRAIRYLPIDSIIIDNYFQFIKDKSYNVLKDNLKSLNNFFKFLENNYNFNNPMKNIIFSLKDYLPEVKYSKILTRGNFLKFLNSVIRNSVNLETDLLLFTLLLSTGCRISEILGLKCNNIDFEDDSFLLINTKNKHQRIVFLRPGMGKIIKNYIINNNREDEDYLFMKKNSKKFSSSEVGKLLNEYLGLANLPQMHIHSFRHTFATLMAEEGTDKLIIAQLLGHESLSSTEIYLKPHYVRNKNIKMPENEMIITFLKNKI
ncbi:tyrosine-type recombinase/integrase [Bacillus sp. CGMCC 1.16607]|uniref:tyrosine-type recombinase/integrase n=1 Tax=Bacillus sp. CGMCC 1.16607 TaxID=3351842 RepID=UPI00363226F7